MLNLARALRFLLPPAVLIGIGEFHAHFRGHYPLFASSRGYWLVVYAGALMLSVYLLRPSPAHITALAAGLFALAAVSVATAVLALAQLATGSPLLPRFVFGGAFVLVGPVLSATELAVLHAAASRRAAERVLLVGSDEEADLTRKDFAATPAWEAAVVSSVTPEVARGGGLERLAADVRPTIVVLSRIAQMDDDVVLQSSVLHRRGIRIRTLSLFYDEWIGKLPLGELMQVSLLFDINEIHKPTYVQLKRFVDLVGSALGATLMLAALPIVWILNLAGNRGPLFYRQARVGKDGKEFTILKFRTMQGGGDESPWTEEGDARVTRVGAVLRATHVDELPQFLNVLAGDMAIVGPRPEQPSYVTALSVQIPFYGLRNLVKPGMTGWAQINYHYGASDIDAMEKLQYEFYYLRHQRIALDLLIIVRTFRTLVRASGR